MRRARLFPVLAAILALSRGAWAVELVEPLPGATVAVGERVTVRVAPEAGEVLRQLSASWVRGGAVEAAPGRLELEIEVPPDAVGPTTLVVFSELSDGTLDMNPVALRVDAGALLDLVVGAPPILDRVGQVVPVEVRGVYEDGRLRDLTDPARGTTYASSDPEILGVDERGAVQARRAGVAQLIVHNGGRTRLVAIRVRVPDPPDNGIPAASAGADQVVPPARVVTLSGADSRDPDGDALTFRWEQRSGIPVVLYAPDTAEPFFVAPAVAAEAVLEFSLVVRDARGATSLPDTVRVTVRP